MSLIKLRVKPIKLSLTAYAYYTPAPRVAIDPATLGR